MNFEEDQSHKEARDEDLPKFAMWLREQRAEDICASEFDKPQQRWLFILATARSGSTTVLKMVNAIPHHYLAGENAGAMSILLRLKAARDEQQNHSKVYAWQSLPIQEELVGCSLRAYTKAIIGIKEGIAPDVIGFKEVRHHDPSELDLFLELFPGARFIICTRHNVEEQVESFAKTIFDQYDANRISEKASSLEAWGRDHADRTFFLQTEEFSQSRFNEMLQWLGVNNCSYRSVAHENAERGYSPAAQNDDALIECKE
eukprot:TRINITY_DN10641_c0_g1_i4.p1 TRINITY_DN10641_c0_g1~~TRINITY_DN10641_c0_g1_i4.p1  ORF type:complete len:259 (-),score=43.58 TRINITY_DN10641_c0_g1_i4:148-924(-)